MNDKFLYLLQEEPDTEFVKALRQKLTLFSPSQIGENENAISMISQHSLAKRITLAFVALILAFALAITISPAVRAAVTDILETIIMRGTTVWVSNDVPAMRGESETYSEIWTPVRPSELYTTYPDFAKQPAWVPRGFLLQERAALFGSMTKDVPYSVLFEWKHAYGGTIQLKISIGSCPNGQLWESGEPRQDCTYRWYFNVDSQNPPEVLMVHDQPAVLLPGLQILMDLSDPIQQWNPYRTRYDNRDPEAFFLIWEADGMRYELATKSGMITKKELVRLAESIP